MQSTETVQIKREVNDISKRVDRLEFLLKKLLSGKGKQLSGLDRGLIELLSGRVHRYGSASELAKDVWG